MAVIVIAIACAFCFCLFCIYKGAGKTHTPKAGPLKDDLKDLPEQTMVDTREQCLSTHIQLHHDGATIYYFKYYVEEDLFERLYPEYSIRA